MQKQTLRRVVPLAVGSSLLLLSLVPATAAFAQNIYISNVQTTADGTSVTASSTTYPAGLHVWYQFRAETPAGHWWILRKFESSPTFTWTPPQSGTYHVQAFALTQYQVATKQWKKAVAGDVTTDSASEAISSISISGAPTANIAVNTLETLSVVAKNSSGTVVTPSAKPTWTLAPTTGATLQTLTDGNVVFDATTAGSYTVTASLDGQTATATIVVYGAPAAIKVSSASSTLVADGQATDTITATVVDSNGNTVPSFNGSLTVTNTGDGVQLLDAAGNPVSGNSETVTAKNGVATFQVQASTIPGTSDTITVTDPTQTTITGNTTISTEAQVATAVKVVTPSTYISANQSNTATVEAEVVDQDGQPMLYGSYPVTFSVSGAATLANASNGTYTTTFTGDGSASNPNLATATIQSTVGDVGAITITASSSNLTSGTGTMQAVIAGVPTQVAATLSASSFAEGSSGVTLNLQAEDAQGVPVNNPDGQVMVNVTQNGAEATNIIVNGTTLTSSDTTGVPVKLNSSGAAAVTINDNNSGADAGTYTVTVTPITGATYTFAPDTLTLTETAGSPTMVSVSTNAEYVSTSAPTAQITAQLQDAYGNPVSEAGVPVTLTSSLSGATLNGSSSVTLDTGSNGSVTATLSLPDQSGDAAFVSASSPNLTGSTSDLITVETEIASTVQVSLEDTQQGSNDYQSQAQAVAGDTITGTVKVLGANGEVVPGTQDVQITVSPAAGLSDVNLASTGTGVYTLDVTNGTGTFTAKAGQEGSFTVTAQDLSVAQQPKGSATMANLPGPVQAYDVFSGTTNVSSSPGLDVTSSDVNTAIPVFVRAVDAAGNPVVSNGNTYVDLSSSALSGTYAFRSSPDGADLSPAQVDIPAGSTGVEVYYVPTATGSVTLTAAAATQQVPSIHETSVTASDAAPGGKITVTVQPENGNGQDVEIPSTDSIVITPMSGADVTTATQTEAFNGSTAPYKATFTAGSTAGTAQFMAQLYDGSTLVETFATEPTAQVTELAGVTPSLTVLQTLNGMDLTGYGTSGATSYAIYRSTGTASVNTSGTPYATTSATSYEDTNVTPGTVYNYAVVAMGTNGAMSQASKTISDEYGTALASSAPAVQTSQKTVVVSFARTSPTKSENLLANSAVPSDFAVSAPGAATQVAQSATVNGSTVVLTFGQTLPSNATVTVQAGAVLDSAGVKNAAGTAAITAVAASDAGTVSLTSDSTVTAGPSNITLSVTPKDTSGSVINDLPASAFTVASNATGAKPSVVSAVQSALNGPYTVTVTDETASSTAQTLTVSVNGVAQTETTSVTVNPAVSAAQDISAMATSPTAATVTWKAPTSGTVANYQVWMIPVVNGTADFSKAVDLDDNVSASATSYAVTNLTAGDTYEFKVDAVDAYGNVVKGTPTSAETQPTSEAAATMFSAAPESGQSSNTAYASKLSDFANTTTGSVLFQIPTVSTNGIATFSNGTTIDLATETPSTSGGAVAGTGYAGVLVATPSGAKVTGVTMNGQAVPQADWGLYNGNLPIYVAIGTKNSSGDWSAVSSIPTTTWVISYSNNTSVIFTTGQES